jgi:hypothetical protein
MNTKFIGNVGEAKTLSKFVELGIPVYIPFGDNEKSDLIAEFNGKLNKIQCKTSLSIKDNKIYFSLVSSTFHRKNGIKHVYSNEEIDYFSLYNIETNILLLIPIEIIEGMKSISFRVPFKEGKHNQFQNYNFEDFLFEKIVL